MKKTIFILFIALISCKTEIKKEVIQEKTVSRVLGKKYFVFDEILHFKNNVLDDEVGDIYENRKLSSFDSIKNGIVLGYDSESTPKSIVDTSFIDNLDKFGYKKFVVTKGSFSAIDSIFANKEADVLAAGCVYVYRDILIFKKKSKIVGIAKICFHCNDSFIVGNKLDGAQINQFEDYQRLEKLLK